MAILQEVRKFAKECGAKVKIAEKYEIAKSTLSTIIKNKERILETFEQSTFAPSRRECGPWLTLQLKKPLYHG